MKKLREKPELLREVREHNVTVFKAANEFSDFDYLESARKRLTSAIIRPRSEMEGSGLRKTYVAIGREWMEEACLKHWRESNKRVIKQVKVSRLMRTTMALSACLFIVANGFAIYHTLRADIIPAFGAGMKRVKAGCLAFEDLSRFANTVLARIAKTGSFDAFLPKGMSLPPEIRMAWRKRLDRLKRASSPKVRTILLDPERKDVYYVVCEADVPGQGEIEFRLQCEKRGERLAFLALE